MLFELQFGKSLDAIQRQLKGKTQDIPQLQNIPELWCGLEFYYDAFLELSHDRQVGFGVGPIPSYSINQFARVLGLDDDELLEFRFLIRRMDATYLEHQAKERERKSKDKPK